MKTYSNSLSNAISVVRYVRAELYRYHAERYELWHGCRHVNHVYRPSTAGSSAKNFKMCISREPMITLLVCTRIRLLVVICTITFVIPSIPMRTAFVFFASMAHRHTMGALIHVYLAYHNAIWLCIWK